MLHLILAGLISLTLQPTTCMEPCKVSVVIRVEPAKNNQRVIVQVESEDSPYYRRTDLDYSNGGPKIFELIYPDIPGGTYTVKVSLHKHDDKTWVAGTDSKTLKVGGR